MQGQSVTAIDSEPLLVQSVFSHFVYGDAAMWLKCIRHPKNAIFTQNCAMNVTPDNIAWQMLLLLSQSSFSI